MAPSKRQNNGRSPLVNPQRQITSFFSKTTSPSPSPSPSPSLSKLKPNKFNSNANANPNPSSSRSPSPSPSPTTPSPLQSRPKKPLLIIGRTPSPSPSTEAASTTKSFAEEVVEKRIRVYWPLDKVWYEGCVKSFDKDSNKHLVLYDDGEEEMLDLGKEKIEWMQVSTKRYKRLRRGSSLVFKKVVIDDDGEAEEKHDNMSESSDDDWDKNVETEKMSDDEDMDLVDEKEEEEKVAKGRKRKANGGGKECKSGGDTVKRGSKVSVTEPMKIVESK